MPGLTLPRRRRKQAYVMAALVAALSLGGGSVGVSPVRASATFAIVDTLGAATPATKLEPLTREDCRSVHSSKSVHSSRSPKKRSLPRSAASLPTVVFLEQLRWSYGSDPR